MDIRDALERCIRTVPDFPIPGIQFRDITPVLANPTLMMQITESFAISVAEELISGMDEWNTEHHHASGLVDRIRSEGVSLEEASNQTCEFISQYIEPGKAPLCGNSIHNDRAFLAKEMPQVLDLLHYRLIDVSTIKELANRWYPDVQRYQKKEAHRALDDILESIEELRHHRATLFKD